MLHGLLPLGGERCAGGAEPATRHGGQGTRRDSREHCLAAKRVVDIGNMAPEGNREMQAAAPLVAAVLAPAGSSLAPLVLAPAAERDARSTATAHPGHHNGLVSWLHIPKCGSSFVAALAGAFCQSIPSEHSVECSLNGSISHWTLSPTRQCPFHHGDVPYCNADGKRPMRDGMPDGVLPSYYALYPASEYCAPGFEWDHGPIHRAVEKDANDAHIAGVVTMLRAPRQRLISAFNGGAHACIGLGGNNLRRMYAGACNAATYARVPGVADCQARMVTDCSSVSTHSSTVHCRSSASLAAESGRRLHALGFVGLVEDWTTSVALFHHTYGGATVPSELENSRPTQGHAGGSDVALVGPGCEFVTSWYDEKALAPAGLGNMSVPATPTAALEPLDTALYAAAVEVFYERVRAAGLLSAAESASRERCLVNLTAGPRALTLETGGTVRLGVGVPDFQESGTSSLAPKTSETPCTLE